MCGIAGVRRYGDNPINAAEVCTLLQSLEHRGNHATGIALMVGREVKIIKAPVPAWNFCAAKETKEFLEAFLPTASIALLHTRFATIGNPEENENNHPMFLGRAAVVHNGHISNHAQFFHELKVERSCETDSDVFRAVLDSQGFNDKSIKIMNRMVGSAAIAAMSPEAPGTLLLARSGSPLIYGVTEDKLWWASEIEAIQRAVRPWETHHGLFGRRYRADVAYHTVPDHTAYLLNNDGLGGKFEFKICTAYKARNYNVRGNYWEKTQGFKRDKKKTAIMLPASVSGAYNYKSGECPSNTCNAQNQVPIDAKFADRSCHKCRTSLAPLDAVGAKITKYYLPEPK